jgi:hypothetical protein
MFNRRIWIAFAPLLAFVATGCGVVAGLLPTQSFSTQEVLSGPQSVPVTSTQGAMPPSSNSASHAGTSDVLAPAETLQPSSPTYTSLVKDLKSVTLTQLDAESEVLTSGPASAYPAEAGVVLTTDTSPMTNQQFWVLVGQGSGTQEFSLHFPIASPGDLSYGPTDPLYAGATYAGSILLPDVRGAITRMLNTGKPIRIYIEICSPGALTGEVKQFGFSGAARPDL